MFEAIIAAIRARGLHTRTSKPDLRRKNRNLHTDGKNPSHTKKGPGRYHLQGK
jgi:hypothetical protein